MAEGPQKSTKQKKNWKILFMAKETKGNYEPTRFTFDTWLSGFIMGQKIYKTVVGDEMALSFREEDEDKMQRVEAAGNCIKRKNKRRRILVYRGDNLKNILEKYAPKTFNSQFVVGLIESDLSVFFSATRDENNAKYIKSRQYIQVQNHPTLLTYFQKARILPKVEDKKVRITKAPDIAAFLSNFAPIYFYLNKEEVVALKTFALKTGRERLKFYENYLINQTEIKLPSPS